MSGPLSWFRGYLGGGVLLGLAMAGVVVASGLESNLGALFLALVLVAAAIGLGTWVFGEQAWPAAGLAVIALLAAGGTVRTVLPRPATTHDFRGTTHRLAPELAGSVTRPGGKHRKPVTHLLVPLVPATWRAGEPLDHWVLDPPRDPARRQGLRLSNDKIGIAREAWGAAVLSRQLRTSGREQFLELVDDPAAEDARRLRRTMGLASALLAAWVIGKPLALVWRLLRQHRRV